LIESPGFLLTIVAFLGVIGPLVFIHELGHYLAARRFGVKAEVFSIGFGREVAGWTDRRGTRWKVGWLPLGGYVRFAGDMGAASQPSAEWLALPAEERNRTFQAKPVWQRAIIVAAGPLINFAAAVLILAGFALAYGESRTPPIADTVVVGSAAARAGLRPGDRVVALNGRAVDTFDDIARYVAIRPRERVVIDAERAGSPVRLQAVIGADMLEDRFGNRMERGLLGMAGGRPVVEPVLPLRAIPVAIRQTGEIVRMTVETLGQVITGRRSVKDMRGPVGMAKAAGEQATLGWAAFIFLVALVSINLGFINLLPIPMLDGGHLLFYAIEAVRRRPVGPEVQEWAYRGGLAALAALMLLVTFNDLGAVGLWRGIVGLIP
jgi:regulator of sigma E protease